MMRIVLTDGYGNEAREGARVTVHWTISVPGPDGTLKEVFDTQKEHPKGISFIVGRTCYCEAVERAVVGMAPGSVFALFCTDMEAASCSELGFKASPIPEGARKIWHKPEGPLGVLQGALEPLNSAKSDEIPPLWQPPLSLTHFHIKLDSTTNGPKPMLMIPAERLDWCHESKDWGTELFNRGQYKRAMRRWLFLMILVDGVRFTIETCTRRRYKKAILDLEIPCQWSDLENVERNRLRIQVRVRLGGIRWLLLMVVALKCSTVISSTSVALE